ncbi:hypothetical protein ACFTS5_12740 [Nocardia sp. NPDC056952]|uniref:hypothetical protein n=1 Tax=Nocardia sp. NPDC056952 TaxID=3345979 RepID=UPI00363973B5
MSTTLPDPNVSSIPRVNSAGPAGRLTSGGRSPAYAQFTETPFRAATNTSTGTSPDLVGESSSSSVREWTLRGVGAIQAALGAALAISAIAGSSVGPARVAMAILGLAFLVLGAATAARPRMIIDRASITTVAVLFDAALTVAGMSVMLVGWADLTISGASAILLAIVAAAVTAIATAFVGARD